jgi:hypothetical protein
LAYNPFKNPEKITTVKIGGRYTPGIAVVDANEASPRKWDEIAGYGLGGASLRFLGRGLTKFTINISLYDRRDLSDWAAFRPHVLSMPRGRNGRLAGFDVWHPALEDINVSKAVLVSLSLPRLTEEGVTEITLAMSEWRELEFKLAKVETSKIGPSDDFADRVLEGDIAELGLLNAQIDALAR